MLEVIVHDDGIGCPPEVRSGVGSHLMQTMAHQLNATLAREPAGKGCRTKLVVPDVTVRQTQPLFHP
jgi:two-component sensor histidine kinase